MKIAPVRVGRGSLRETDHETQACVTFSVRGSGCVRRWRRWRGRCDCPACRSPQTNASQPEGNAGTTNFTFTVSRSGDASAASSANWAVSGAAVSAADFAGSMLPSGSVELRCRRDLEADHCSGGRRHSGGGRRDLQRHLEQSDRRDAGHCLRQRHDPQRRRRNALECGELRRGREGSDFTRVLPVRHFGSDPGREGQRH